MDKKQELEKLRAQVSTLEAEVAEENKQTVEAITGQISTLVSNLEQLYKEGARPVRVQIGGNSVEYDGYDWTPTYGSDWYSSSMEC